MSDWNSGQYMKYKKQRTQPSVDLISRLLQLCPRRILDTGCGPGNSTSALAKAFPDAEITGIDSSEEMLKAARAAYPDMRFLRICVPDELDVLEGKYDLIFSNACIHWIPEQRLLIERVMDRLCEGGCFAVQIPLIQEAPFYKLLGKLTKTEKWRRLACVKVFYNLLPEEYYDLFSSLGCGFDMWQTSYYHIMDSLRDIIEWYKGSGLRPYLDLLEPDEQDELKRDILAELGKYYAKQADNRVILKMPRLFFVLSGR